MVWSMDILLYSLFRVAYYYHYYIVFYYIVLLSNRYVVYAPKETAYMEIKPVISLVKKKLHNLIL